MSTLKAVLERLECFVIDGEETALDEACTLLAANQAPAEVNALMQGLMSLKSPKADKARFSLAQRRVRAALGLPMHIGAICRPSLGD